MKDFFVSYNAKDRAWAEWIAWQLEEAGFSVVIQAWDFVGNWVVRMDAAMRDTTRTIAVLSQDYLAALYTQTEWANAFLLDPTGTKDLLIPVRVRPAQLAGVFAQIVYVDFVDVPETTAIESLLKRVRGERGKPARPPNFPGAATPDLHRVSPSVKPPYPAQDEDTKRLRRVREILADWRGRYGARVEELRQAGKKARAWNDAVPTNRDEEMISTIEFAAAVAADLRSIPLSELEFATDYGLSVHPTVFWWQALDSVRATEEYHGRGGFAARASLDAELGLPTDEVPGRYEFEMMARVLESAEALARFNIDKLPRGFVEEVKLAPLENARAYRSLVLVRKNDDPALHLIAVDDKPVSLGSLAARTLPLDALCARRQVDGSIDVVAADSQHAYRLPGSSSHPTLQYPLHDTALTAAFISTTSEPAVAMVKGDGTVDVLGVEGTISTIWRAPTKTRFREAAIWVDQLEAGQWRVIAATDRHGLVSASPDGSDKQRSSETLWDDWRGSGSDRPRWHDLMSVTIDSLDGFPCVLVGRQAHMGEGLHFLDPKSLAPLRAPFFVPGFVGSTRLVAGRWLVAFFLQRGTEVVPRIAVWDLLVDSAEPIGRWFERRADIHRPIIVSATTSAFEVLFVQRPFDSDTRHRLCRFRWPAGTIDVLEIESELRIFPVDVTGGRK